MIPQIIHYVWVGKNEVPAIFQKCKKSWERFCPDYEIRLWTENDIDYKNIPFLSYAYETSQFSRFANHYRTWIIYHYGGFYLDIDVELIKPLDSLTQLESFFGVDKYGYINLGSSFGSSPNNDVLKTILMEYDSMDFSENPVLVSGPTFETMVFNKLNLFDEKIRINYNLTLLSSDFFDPFDWKYMKGEITGNTIGIHHYTGSWVSNNQRNALKLMRKLHPLLGSKITDFLEKLIYFVDEKFSKNNQSK